MSTRSWTLPLIALPLLLAVTDATAQQLDLQSPVPQRPQDRSKHQADEPRARRPHMPETDLYPHRPPVPYQPGFIDPLTKETETGRMGVAGWTSPNMPTGSRVGADPDNAGWLGFGFAIEWGGPKKTMTR